MNKPKLDPTRTAAPSQPTSPKPEGMRRMMEAHEKSLPMDQDPQMKPALDRFRCLADNLKPMTPEAPKLPESLSFSHLPPDVQARVIARSAVAKEAATRYWAYVAEQDAKETPGLPEP